MKKNRAVKVRVEQGAKRNGSSSTGVAIAERSVRCVRLGEALYNPVYSTTSGVARGLVASDTVSPLTESGRRTLPVRSMATRGRSGGGGPRRCSTRK